ncbi:hypothetical protein BGX29_004498 [Mortierella sp. GBA35]|nr:hypothetical protein BGX29_004498 [Mortierella sp. GBA35]
MLDSELKEMIFGVCPSSTDWTLCAKDLTPNLTRCLNDLPNIVTSLELFWPERAHCRPDSGLHAYLCASPHLLHLKASNIALRFALLDLHHRVNFDYSQHDFHRDSRLNPTKPASPSSRVWKCRNIRTLHLAFHNHGLSLLTSPTHSRVLFGYISRVCPQLRDLEIHKPEQYTRLATTPTMTSKHDQHFPNLDMRLHGGFCLLSRLKHLKRLRLGRVQQRMDFDPVHLNWTVASGHSAKCREERRNIVAGWGEWVLEETQLLQQGEEDRWVGEVSGGNKEGLGTLGGDVVEDKEDQLMRDLQHLGLVLDVKNVLEEMDQKDYRCWPVL